MDYGVRLQTPSVAFTVGVCLALVGLLSCGFQGADDGMDPVLGPARIIRTDRGNGAPRDTFSVGEEVRITFDRDPGVVDIVYAGRHRVDVAGDGVVRAFLILSSPIWLTWEEGGSLMLEYDSIIGGEISAPAAGPLFPDPNATDVGLDELRARGIVLFVDPPLSDPSRIIPRAAVTDARITVSDGTSWVPELTSEGFEVTLRPDAGAAFVGAETYRVRAVAELTYVTRVATYRRAATLWARTKRSSFMTKPPSVTAWIVLGNLC